MDLKIRRAANRDIYFIMRLGEKDSQAGHYVKYPSRVRGIIGEFLTLRSIINRGVNINPNLEAAAFVFELGGKKIGFARILVTPFRSALNPQDPIIELHMFSVHPKYRGQKYGSRCLDALIGAFPKNTKFMARCMPASARMIKMLKGVGFHEAGTIAGTHILLKAHRSEAMGFGRSLKRMVEGGRT